MESNEPTTPQTPASEATLDAHSLTAGKMRVVLERQKDRFAHRVELARESLPLLESIEGTDHQDWPASPPLQDWHEQTLDASSFGLLIGQAGRSHWSLSIEADGESGRLVFDAACRARELPQNLGSSYRLPAGIECRSSGDRAEFLAAGQPVAELELLAIAGWSAELVHRDGQLRIVPSVAESPLPCTVRWKYALRPVRSA